MHLTYVDVTVLVGYFAILSLIGVYFSRQQKSRDEYILGGRQIHWVLAGGSTVATLLSSLSFLSIPGETISHGISYFASLLALPFVVLVVNRTVAPMLRELPIRSAYEYLEKRFDIGTRKLASGVFVFKTLIWMGLILYSSSFAFAQIAGWGILSIIVVLGIITTLYTSIGGFKTVIWTDNLQLYLLLGGALLIPFYVGFSTGHGPIRWYEDFSLAGRMHVQVFSWDPTVRITLFGVMVANFFWHICTYAGDQMAVQRILGTPNLKTTRRAVWTFAGFNALLTPALVICGLALFAYYAQSSGLSVDQFQREIQGQGDQLMPRFIAQELPSGISGLLLAALLAAAMSSLSSAINAISGVVVSDFLHDVERVKHHGSSLLIDKLIAVSAGLLGIGGAVAINIATQHGNWNLLELTNRINHLFVGPLAVLFFGSILLKRAGKEGILLGFASGVLVSFIVSFGKDWFGLAENISFLWVVPGSFLVGMLIAWFSSVFSVSPKVGTLGVL